MSTYWLKDLHEIEHYIEINRFEHAIDKIKELLAQEPNKGRLLYLLAYCNYSIDNNEEALEYCYDAIENDYSTEECQALIGRINIDMGNYKEAEEAFINVLSINPENAEILAAYGNLLAITGFEKKGKVFIEEALRLKPENIVVLQYQSLYFINAEKKEDNETTELLENIVANSDDQVVTFTHLGIHCYYKNKFKASLKYLRQAYTLDPTNQDLLKFLKLVEYQSRIFFRPLHWVNRVGGPIVLWVTFIVLMGICSYLNMDTLRNVLLLVYFIYFVYSWIAAPIHNRFLKRNNYETR